jgi:hypothetical protein
MHVVRCPTCTYSTVQLSKRVYSTGDLGMHVGRKRVRHTWHAEAAAPRALLVAGAAPLRAGAFHRRGATDLAVGSDPLPLCACLAVDRCRRARARACTGAHAAAGGPGVVGPRIAHDELAGQGLNGSEVVGLRARTCGPSSVHA